MTHTPATLLAFRDRVADAFREKRIRCPVHFPSSEQAAPLIDVFKDFRPGVDWCFAGWRNMWACLLAGMPEDELFQMILDGRSMYPMSAYRHIFCSSIVGGILPVALGVAWSIRKQYRQLEREAAAMCEATWDKPYDGPLVYVLVGDMTARTGLYHEFWQYASGHDLPVRVCIEDNGLSTNSQTEKTWGQSPVPNKTRVRRYSYRRDMPHVGLLQRVSF